MVVKRITCLHEVIYTLAGKYEELSIPLVVQGYLIVMKAETVAVRAKMATHLQELMGDTEIYGWERVRAYHGVWLNKLEQDWATWGDEVEKVRFQHDIIWHSTTSAPSPPSTSVVSGAEKQIKLGFTYNTPARLGMKSCKAFNEGNCTNAAAHTNQLHVCSHCLAMVGRTFTHQEIDCNRKQFPP